MGKKIKYWEGLQKAKKFHWKNGKKNVSVRKEKKKIYA